VVAEVNQGGDMVENVLRTIDANVAYKSVRASRGKIARAEPVAALFEQRRVSHCGVFSQLEDQMWSFTPAMPRKNGSPDRCDALVWALSELLVEHDSFDHAMRTMTALYSENLAPTTGDPLIDRGIWAPKKDDGSRVRLRMPAGVSTVYSGHTGRRYQIDEDGCIDMAPENANYLALRSGSGC
jgi:hypothetical protein